MRSLMIILLTLLLSFSSSAQNMETLFYGRSWSDVPLLLDSIKRELPTFYLQDSVLYKNEKGISYKFNSTDNKVILVNLEKFKKGSETIGPVQIIGSFESIIKVYSKYILRDSRPTKYDENCWPVVVKNTSSGRMPISFCRAINHDWPNWRIENRIPF